MTETFDDGTRVHKGPNELHYSLKGGHFFRGQFWRAWRDLPLAPIRAETSWQIRRYMKRVPLDGKR